MDLHGQNVLWLGKTPELGALCYRVLKGEKAEIILKVSDFTSIRDRLYLFSLLIVEARILDKVEMPTSIPTILLSELETHAALFLAKQSKLENVQLVMKLPVDEESLANALQKLDISTRKPLLGKRILVTAKEEVTRKVIVTICENLGAEVGFQADSVYSAASFLPREFDFHFLDLELPDLEDQELGLITLFRPTVLLYTEPEQIETDVVEKLLRETTTLQVLKRPFSPEKLMAVVTAINL